MSDSSRIKIVKNGPYIVNGSVPLNREVAVPGAIYPVKWEKGEAYQTKERYSLCRCGKSTEMPFCDGSHSRINFDGTETASKSNYKENCKRFTGPGIDLDDAEKLCSGARFCDVAGGTWDLTEKSDNPKSRAIAIQQACDCPSGRLVAIDKTDGKPIEPAFDKSISVTDDPSANASGPLWIKGGVPIESSDGSVYEVRNRVTLCRCGQSKNKPFCDGEHLNGFQANDS
jgi:CDGSH-type Zn-finger protein